MSDQSTPEDRRAWLRGIRREALERCEAILANVGPKGRTPLLSIRTIPGRGGDRRHASSEGVAVWYEPEELYLAVFKGKDGQPRPEVLVEQEDALRWMFALGWDKGEG